MKTLLILVLATASAIAEVPRSAGELNNQAVKLAAEARYAEAEQLYRRAIDLYDHEGADGVKERAIAEGNLGSLMRVLGRYSEAEQLLQDSLHELRREGDGAQTGRVLVSLAALYRSQGDPAKAEPYAVEAAGMLDREPSVQPKERETVRLILSSIYMDEHNYAGAEAILGPAAATAKGTFAVTVFNNLAVMAIAVGDYGKAESYAQKAMEESIASLPPSHPARAVAINNLAQACRFQGRYLEAEKYYREAIDLWEKSVGPRHPDVAKGLMNLAAFYHERGREAGAESLYNRAVAILEQSVGPNNPQTLTARNELAEVLRAEHRFSESERLGRVTMQALEKVLEPGDPRVIRALTNRAKLLSETRRQNEADHLLARIQQIQTAFR
jgi:tetratricopeptide (TPR) repeat protein